MFHDTWLHNTDSLLQMWTKDWNSIYQFSHDLWACSSIMVMDDPNSIAQSNLLQHPLWMPIPSPSTFTLIPKHNKAHVALVAGGSLTTPGAWAVSSILLLPAGGNLPIGFGGMLDKKFSCNLFLNKLADQHGTILARHVDSWLQGPSCNSWFQAIQQSPQMHSALDVILNLENSLASLPYAFLAVMWQGIYH